jgi:hypothetical protein
LIQRIFLILLQDKSASSSFVPATWSRWTYNDVIPPQDFFEDVSQSPDNLHVWSAWVNDSSWAGNRPYKLASALHIEQILLGVGLALRVLNLGLYTEPDERPANIPTYVWDVTQPSFDLVWGLAMKLAEVAEM